MVRNLFFILVLLVVAYVHPPLTAANEQTTVGYCPLDGYLSSSFTKFELLDVANKDQPLVLEFSINNDSAIYSYGAVEIGIGLYKTPTDNFPAYWSPVTSDTEFLPNTTQTFESMLDVSAVPAGQYIVKVGVAQGGQLAALVNSLSADGLPFTKTTPGSQYVVEITPEEVADAVGTVAQYNLLTENNSDAVERGFDQHVVIFHGDTPIGSALLNSLTKPVKMIPGSTERTTISSLIDTEGVYTVLGYFTKENTMLPLVTDTFTVGSAAGPNNVVYISGVGVSSLDQPGMVTEVVSCVDSVSEELFDVVQLVQQVLVDDTNLTTHTAEVSEGGFVRSVLKKEDLLEFTVESKLYTTSNQVQTDSAIDTDLIDVGLHAQTISQSFRCEAECQISTFGETLEAFVTEDAVRSTFWFYLGIILAAALLLLLMLGRLPTPEKDDEPMHQPQ